MTHYITKKVHLEFVFILYVFEYFLLEDRSRKMNSLLCLWLQNILNSIFFPLNEHRDYVYVLCILLYAHCTIIYYRTTIVFIHLVPKACVCVNEE